MRSAFSELRRAHLADLSRLVGRNVISITIGLGVASIVTSLLTREQYGSYRFVIDIAAAIAFLSLPGLNQVVMQDTAKKLDGTLSRVWRRRLAASLVYSVVLMGLAIFFYLSDQELVARGFAAVAPLFPAKNALDAYRYYVLGRQEFRLYTTIPVVIQIIASAGTVLAAFLTRDPVVMLVVLGVIETLLHVLAFSYVLRVLPPRNDDSSPTGMRFGIGLSAANVTASISAQLDTILVGTLLAMPDVALLALATLPVKHSKILLNVLGEYFGPRVVAESGARLFRRANPVIALTGAIVLAYVAVGSVLMSLFFRIFFPDYSDAVPLAIVALCSLLLGAPVGIMEQTLFAQERLAQTSLLRGLQIVVDVVVTVVLIRLFGVLGAVSSRVVASLFRLVSTSLFYFRNRNETI